MCANRPLAAIAVGLLLCGQVRAEQAWHVLRAGETAESENIRNELEKPTQADFIETPLDQALRYLGDYHDIRIRANVRALDDVGLDPKTTPVTTSAKDISLRSVLKLILDDHDLAFVVRGHVLLVTTPEDAARYVETKAYAVGGLLEEDESAAAIAEAIANTLGIATNRSSNAVGESSTGIGAYKQLLIVRGNQELHEQVAEVLKVIQVGLVAPKAKPLPRDFKGASHTQPATAGRSPA